MSGSRIEGSGSRAHAIRMQQLIAQIRHRDDPQSTYETRPRGPSPAQRSAQNMGIGDNLKAALSDVFTQDNPVASSFADELNGDPVLGDGTLEPGTAFASVEVSISGQLNQPIKDPLDLARQTGSRLALAGQAAMLSHGALSGSGVLRLT